jgi:hypothetical protein
MKTGVLTCRYILTGTNSGTSTVHRPGYFLSSLSSGKMVETTSGSRYICKALPSPPMAAFNQKLDVSLIYPCHHQRFDPLLATIRAI